MALYFQGYCKQDLYRLNDTKMGVVVQFLVHERSKILGSDFSRKLAVLTQTEFCWEFPRRKTLCRKSITKIVEKFRATRTVGNDIKGQRGQYVTVSTHVMLMLRQ